MRQAEDRQVESKKLACRFCPYVLEMIWLAWYSSAEGSILVWREIIFGEKDELKTEKELLKGGIRCGTNLDEVVAPGSAERVDL